MKHLATDVLVVGAGGAGMYAAIAAARNGAEVALLDKSLISRGGATIMAQMTVAAAVGHQSPDHWTNHLEDTLNAGRGLCNAELAAILCAEAPERIFEMDEWRVGWTREDGHLKQVTAPGHNVPRCCFVDFLNTGPAVASTLRSRVAKTKGITRISQLPITDIVIKDGRAIGAVGFDPDEGEPVTFAAKAVVLAAGGLTSIFRRNSASANMGGDAYALALRAGAELVDMEFVQFFPIGHLAPRLVGLDPIMWDPFRYKLGGRLLNGDFEEFIEAYGSTDRGTYTATRDVASYAIIKENEAGRGSPHGGVYLSFEHIPEPELRAAFGPVIDRLAANDIDLTQRPIEVSPIAHYHMGGIRVDARMATRIEGLFAAGEAVGGANGANRLSGNAIPEAFVFGERAGRFAAESAANAPPGWDATAAAPAIELIRKVEARDGRGRAEAGRLFAELQDLMWDEVGLSRTGATLSRALERLREMQSADLAKLPLAADPPYHVAVQDWFNLRASLLAGESVAAAALARTESRGAHQREDYPDTDPAQERNLVLALDQDRIATSWAPVVREAPSMAEMGAAR